MRKLITTTEALLVFTDYRNAAFGQRIDETHSLGRELTAFDALAFLDVDTFKVKRADLEADKLEDITETCAEAWITDMEDGGYDLDDYPEDKLPVYVANSMAWAQRCMTEPVQPYNALGTLDHKTQGLSRVNGARF